MSRKTLTTFAMIAITVGTMGTAVAQMDNKPFSFKNSPSGGPGMSKAGKQAIIEEQLFDSTPDNLQRGSNGQLVDVTKGPGHSAIVFEHGTTSSIPEFDGTGFRGKNELMQVGVFNPYFGLMHDSSDYAGYTLAQFHTAGLINSWTMSMVAGNIAAPYYGNNTVDAWTSFVNSLERF